MAKRIRVKPGDIFVIPVEENLFGVGIVLHVSKYFRNSIMVGLYDTFFKSAYEIQIERLETRFINTPNYTGKQLLTSGDWPIIGHSERLLLEAPVPELVASYTLFYKDEIVRDMLSLEETRMYPTLLGQGGIYIQDKLRRFFQENSNPKNNG
jgi:hypothetical protein